MIGRSKIKPTTLNNAAKKSVFWGELVLSTN